MIVFITKIMYIFLDWNQVQYLIVMNDWDWELKKKNSFQFQLNKKLLKKVKS